MRHFQNFLFLFFQSFLGFKVLNPQRLLLTPMVSLLILTPQTWAGPRRAPYVYQKTFKVAQINVTLDTVKNSSYAQVRWRLSKSSKKLGPEQNNFTLFGGPYFKPSNQALIDLVVKDGKTLKSYRWDWGRPILQFWPQGVRIIRVGPRKKPPKKRLTFPKGHHAFAADSMPTNGKKVAGRQVVSLHKGQMTLIRMWATERYTRTWLKRRGHTNYVFLDGGSSSPPSAPIPVHMVIHKRAVPTLKSGKHQKR